MKYKSLASLLMMASCLPLAGQTVSLDGKWAFAKGDKPEYNDEVILPGSMLTNGKGDDIDVNTNWTGSLYDSSYFHNPYMKKYRQPGNMSFPFFLTPSKHYTGNAWYRKVVRIAKNWKKKTIVLSLERPHIETTVYVNGQLAGRDSSLSVAHEFDVTPFVKWGEDNEIAIRIYNGIENVCVGQDSHSVTDQTQGNWNGIVGRIELKAREHERVENVQIYPDVEKKEIKVVMELSGNNHRSDISFLVAELNGDSERSRNGISEGIKNGNSQRKEKGESQGKKNRGSEGKTSLTRRFRFKNLRKDAEGKVTVTIPMGDDVKLWDEFHPNLYRLTSVMGKDTVNTTFALSQLSIKGRQFYMNGKPVWMRGTVENCCFPETGYPPTDEASWLRIFEKCKEYGLNMMRFHSFCPPEAAFAAADKVGFYLQPEGPSWPNHGVKLGNGMSIDRYLLEETQRMVRAYGNHPSFCMLAAGNEPAGNWVKWVGDFVDYWKSTGDKRRVYCGASVGGGWAWDAKSEYHVKGGARGLDWNNRAPQSEDNFNENILKVTQKGKTPITFDVNEPLLTHEMGQWCAFPDLKERNLYTGAYKAKNFDIFEDLLNTNGMSEQAENFLHASGKLQTLAYKYDIERNLRTKDYAGFQLLSLNDYSGQGTALVGVLGVHWNEKGYCTSDDWKQFCSSVVPLARFPKFVYSNADTLRVPVELYNASSDGLNNVSAWYTLTDETTQMSISHPFKAFYHKTLNPGKNINIGMIQLPLAEYAEPVKLRLTININSAKGGLHEVVSLEDDEDDYDTYSNSYEFWVYPANVEMPKAKGIYVTDSFDSKAKSVLRRGGKVLVLAAGKVTLGADVKQTYLPVFWNTSWFKMRPPHTTGAYIDTKHPLFKRFLSDDWGNLNWWELLNKAQVMNLRELPADYQPAIQPIDTWHVSRKLGMMIEANVLGGKLLMTTMDLSRELDHRLVAREMRKAMLDYMESADFNPSLNLDEKTISDFFTKSAPAVNMFTNDSPDELKPVLK